MNVKLLNDHLLRFLSLKGGCTGSSESSHVKMPHCWKSHAAAHVVFFSLFSSDGHNSPELLGAFSTKSTPTVYLDYAKHNVLLASGAVADSKT